MQQYLDLMRRVRTQGVRKTDRTGTGTLSVFGHQMRFDLAAGFPLVTTKKLHLKSIIHELIWFLPGDTNTNYLKAHGVSHLGRVGRRERRPRARSTASSGAPGRRPDGRSIDQIREVVETLKTNPDSRRMIVTAWNPADIPDMALAPCHCLFQFYVADGRLSCQLYQRSADVFLGVPFNIASYALLTMMMAQVTGLKPGEFVHTFGDAHLYLNHLEQADLQLSRTPRPLPRMQINPGGALDLRFQVRGFRAHRLRPAPAHQGRGGGVIAMMALSIRPPWAWAIIHARQGRREPIAALQASAAASSCMQAWSSRSPISPRPHRPCVPRASIRSSPARTSSPPAASSAPWSWSMSPRLAGASGSRPAAFAWILRNPRPMPFLPYTGRRSWFHVPDDLIPVSHRT